MKKHFIFSLFFLFFILSCRKKLEMPRWEINALFPVAYTSLKISELVKDSVLKTNPDQSLSIVYSGEVYKIDFDSLFQIPDTSILQSFKAPFGGFPVNPGFTFYNQVQSTKYNLQGVELTEAIVRSGTIEVELHSTFRGKTALTYQLPLATINGNFFSISDTLPAAVAGSSSVIYKTYDITGYKLNLKGTNGNSFNTVVSSFKAIAVDTTMIYLNDSITVVNNFINVVPEFAKGYFGKAVIDVEPANTAVKKLSHIVGGTLDMKYFDLKLKIQNGVGVDIQFLLNEIKSQNFSAGSSVLLSSSVVGSSININRAAINSALNYPPIVNSEYVINLNNSNSNADELIEIFPDSISAGVQITLNPLGNISNSNDFVYYGNGINVTLDAEIPLCFSANNLILQDTLDVNFQPDSDATKKIIDGNLILDCYNGYPFEAKPQIFLLNQNDVIYDSLITNNTIINTADLDANFKSVGKKFSKILIPVNQEKIEKLKAAKKLMVKLFFSTAAQPNYVKIYSDYSVELKLVADINYSVEND